MVPRIWPFLGDLAQLYGMAGTTYHPSRKRALNRKSAKNNSSGIRISKKCKNIFGNIENMSIFAFGFGNESNRPDGLPVKSNKDMEKLKYTTREINRNYKIKVSGTFEGQKVNTLVGVSGLIRMVNDIELTNRLLDRAFNDMTDCCICKLRRGIKISFYVS